jgi:hypothetical protein
MALLELRRDVILLNRALEEEKEKTKALENTLSRVRQLVNGSN